MKNTVKKKLIVRQEEAADCGISSLESIIRYYGGNVSLEELRISSLTSINGVNAYNLIECAKKYSFDAIGINTDKLDNLKLPCIAHLKINESLSHFVCIYNINKDYVTLMDPSSGEVKMNINDFNDISTKNFILLTPKTHLSYITHPNHIKINFKNLIKTNKKTLANIIILNILYLLFSLIIGSYVIFIKPNTNIIKILLIYILISLISNYTYYLIKIKSKNLQNTFSSSLISNFLHHIFNLPFNYLHIKEYGEIVKRVQDMENIQDIIINFIISISINSILILISLIIIININIKIFLVSLISIIIYLLIILIKNRNIKDHINEVITSSTDYHSMLVDLIQGLTSIKHTMSECFYLNKLNDSYKYFLDYDYNYNKEVLKTNFLKQSLLSSIELFINIILVNNLINNNISINNYVITIYIYNLLINSVINIAEYIPSIIYINKVIIKVNEFYNVNEENNKGDKFINGDIKITNLSFSYNNYNKILNNFDLNINKNDKVIIKGESGAGKSTLCKLLNKEYDNYQGNILIGNINLKDISIFNLRSHLSYSSQNEKILIGTIRDNILMGRNISNDKLNNIIKICELNRILNKRIFGLDTFLYGGDSELSGGEKELIFLARTLVLNRDIIILDETLSEVNEELEHKILTNLFNNYNDKTIIYITHKNSKNYFEKTIYV